MTEGVQGPALAPVDPDAGLVARNATSDNRFHTGRGDVVSITATGDGKVEFVAFAQHTLAHVTSSMGYPAYYPVRPVALRKPVKAVLMDLDGTSVRSEDFWIWIIEQTVASLRREPGFRLQETDIPYVSGHSVSEHLRYCMRTYCAERTVEEAREVYFEHTRREMAELVAGRGRQNAFVPSPGLKAFLLALKAADIKIALVTSGLHEKAWPEILAAFRTLDLGDPATFYDAIVTAGFQPAPGQPGTLGELQAKPHPWLYAEAARVGLGIDDADRDCVVGIEDSGAGVCAIRLAGFTTIGYAGGNIDSSGTRALCHHYCEDFEEVLRVLQ